MGWDIIYSTGRNRKVQSMLDKNGSHAIPLTIRSIIEGKKSEDGGSRRCVYLNEYAVLKYVWHSTDFTIGQQIVEARNYLRNKYKLPLAKCKLFSNNGFLSLLMERVEQIDISQVPRDMSEKFFNRDTYNGKKWGILAHDAKRQCGINKNGKIVVYDYGVEDTFKEDGTLDIFIHNLKPLTETDVIDFTKRLATRKKIENLVVS